MAPVLADQVLARRSLALALSAEDVDIRRL
jgi:hypothetical protein